MCNKVSRLRLFFGLPSARYRGNILRMVTNPDEIDTDARVRSFRAEYRASEIPSGYRGGVHFLITNTMVLTAVVLCVMQLDAVQFWEWWTIPITFLYANLSEYVGHRFVMHKLRPGFGLIFKRHTKQHHRFFTNTTMPVDSFRDFKAVLFPPILIGFFLGAFGTPIALLIGNFVSVNCAWLFAITGLLYFLNYEYLHSAYHLPNDHWIGRLPGLSGLRRLHETHHDQSIMTRCNFNITYPLCDWLFRTLR